MEKEFGGVIWTDHALERLRERGIKQGDAWATFRRPDKSRYAKAKSAWVYYKTYGKERIEVVAKKNEKGRWIVLSVWSRPAGNKKKGKKEDSLFMLIVKKLLKKGLVSNMDENSKKGIAQIPILIGLVAFFATAGYFIAPQELREKIVPIKVEEKEEMEVQKSPSPSPSPTESPEPTVTPTPSPTPESTPTPAPAPVSQSNSPPGAGYSRQSVSTDVGSFLVSMIAADISSTTVLVDTAATSDCSSNCPVLSLGEYVSRNGGWAGVNGTYFCPQDYASCAGQENTYDLLVMNKDKTYFNSGNNVYSNNPAVIFGNGYVRFVTAASQWGRDTSPNGVISNFPLLVFNSQITFGGDGDPKKGSKGGRSFVATKGNTVYVGVVHSATVAESARALHALGMDNAMNLDDGGSTALWHGGYKVGPGRNIPNAIIFR